MDTAQIQIAIAQHGADPVYQAAMDAMGGNKAHLNALGLTGTRTLADIYLISSVASQRLTGEERASHTADAAIELSQLQSRDSGSAR